MTDSREYIKEILDKPAYFSSMLIFLKQVHCKGAMSILGMPEHTLPPFTYEWLEELLTGILFSKLGDIAMVRSIRKEIKNTIQLLKVEFAKIKPESDKSREFAAILDKDLEDIETAMNKKTSWTHSWS